MKLKLPFLATCILALCVTGVAQTKIKKITVIQRDNAVISGELLSLSAERVVVRTAEGRQAMIAIDDVYELLFDSQPTPTSQAPATVDPVVFARCLSAFHRILSAVEIGVTYIAYREELLEAKVELDRAIVSLPVGPQRTDLLESLQDLIIAADAWQIGIQNEGIPTKTDFYRSLNERYQLGVNPRIGQKVSHSALLKIIWAKASSRLEHAMSLQK